MLILVSTLCLVMMKNNKLKDLLLFLFTRKISVEHVPEVVDIKTLKEGEIAKMFNTGCKVKARGLRVTYADVC